MKQMKSIRGKHLKKRSLHKNRKTVSESFRFPLGQCFPDVVFASTVFLGLFNDRNFLMGL
jgi:hypothetical protein